jgi:putative proteasome-type protease
MTYCLALRLHEGLVFLADTRTNAGVDNISTYRKLHVLRPAPDRVFVLESAGNLATTHEVLDRIEADLQAVRQDPSDGRETLASVTHLFEAALYVGRLGGEVSRRHRAALSAVGADGTATFILGGQIAGSAADILLVYPEGNYIRASDDRPFLQIGESKYGKFMLEFAVEAHVDLATATKIALGSMMSTAQANLSVGPPYDLGVCRNDSLTVDEFRITPDSALLRRLQGVWEKHLTMAVADLPTIQDLEAHGEAHATDDLGSDRAADPGTGLTSPIGSAARVPSAAAPQ